MYIYRYTCILAQTLGYHKTRNFLHRVWSSTLQPSVDCSPSSLLIKSVILLILVSMPWSNFCSTSIS